MCAGAADELKKDIFLSHPSRSKTTPRARVPLASNRILWTWALITMSQLVLWAAGLRAMFVRTDFKATKNKHNSLVPHIWKFILSLFYCKFVICLLCTIGRIILYCIWGLKPKEHNPDKNCFFAKLLNLRKIFAKYVYPWSCRQCVHNVYYMEKWVGFFSPEK